MPSLKEIILGQMGGSFDKGVGAGSQGYLQYKQQGADANQISQKADLDQQNQAAEMSRERTQLDQLRKQNPRASVHVGKYSVNPEDNLLKQLAMKSAQDDRFNKQTAGLTDDIAKAGTPAAVANLQRAETDIPGIGTGQAQFKSVGGWKNWVPNALVPLAEKIPFVNKAFPEGSAKERAGIQDLTNTAIYDASGKAVNESEMRRMKDAAGLFGAAPPETINEFGKQLAGKAMNKSMTAGAGYDPKVVNTVRARGAPVATQGEDLYDLLSQGDPEKAQLLRLRAAKAKKGGR